MWKKIAVAGSVGAVVLGAGTAASLAATAGGGPTPQPSASAGAGAHAKGHGGRAQARGKIGQELRHTLHATWTTRSKTGFVTHDAIRGAVSSVSPSSIAVKAADGTSQTYAITKDTKVRVHRAAGSLSAVKVGDQVGVIGTGTSTLTATRVLDPQHAAGAKTGTKTGSAGATSSAGATMRG